MKHGRSATVLMAGVFALAAVVFCNSAGAVTCSTHDLWGKSVFEFTAPLQAGENTVKVTTNDHSYITDQSAMYQNGTLTVHGQLGVWTATVLTAELKPVAFKAYTNGRSYSVYMHSYDDREYQCDSPTGGVQSMRTSGSDAGQYRVGGAR